MEVTGSSVPSRESRSAPSLSRLSRPLLGLLIVCSGVALTYAIYRAWKSDQPPVASRSTDVDEGAVEAVLADSAKVPQPAPVTLAAARASQRPSEPGVAQAAFEAADTTDSDHRVRKEPPRRAAWLTGTIEAVDEKAPPVGKPIPTFDKPLRNPPAIDP